MSLARKGRPNPHKPPTEETKRKISETLKAKHLVRSPETRAKMSAGRKGKFPSLETRAKMSAAQKGRNPSLRTLGKLQRTTKVQSRDTNGRFISEICNNHDT